MTTFINQWPEALQLLAPIVALGGAGAAFWVQSAELKRASEKLRKAAEAELEISISAASSTASALELDLDLDQLNRKIKDLEFQTAHLRRQIAEAQSLANQVGHGATHGR